MNTFSKTVKTMGGYLADILSQDEQDIAEKLDGNYFR